MGISVFKASGRAKCRACREMIREDTYDLEFTAMGGSASVSRHYHLKCVLRKIAEAM